MDNNKETISRIKFIGKIQIGEKVNLKYMSMQNDGFYTQLSRIIFQENRGKTLTFLQDTISKTFEIIKCYQKSKKKYDQIMCMNLVQDLRNSRVGFSNLKETYNHDIKFCCDIDTILQLIDAKLTESDLPIPPPIFDSSDEYLIEEEEKIN